MDTHFPVFALLLRPSSLQKTCQARNPLIHNKTNNIRMAEQFHPIRYNQYRVRKGKAPAYTGAFLFYPVSQSK